MPPQHGTSCQACGGKGAARHLRALTGGQMHGAQHPHPTRPGYVGRQRGWSGQSLRQLPKFSVCPEVEVQLDPPPHRAALPDRPSPVWALGIGTGVSDRVRKRGPSPMQHGSMRSQMHHPPGRPSVEPRLWGPGQEPSPQERQQGGPAPGGGSDTCPTAPHTLTWGTPATGAGVSEKHTCPQTGTHVSVT